jgi:hypothetical protein
LHATVDRDPVLETTMKILGLAALGCLYGVRRLGLPSGAWWKAVPALIALILFCRLVTPPRANVNVAFAIYPGWEKVFPSHPIYLAVMMGLSAGYFVGFEYVLRRWLARKTALGETT